MPEKEGAEEKTTKEVVNKKQKQMMNKEEYTTEMVKKIKKKISARAVFPTVAQNKVRGEIVKGDDLKIDNKNPVKKKMQKNNLDEEGYDIARDMGRVKPSKDKKDATTMPPSKEMEKTRKVNKGPSALELVKKKYKGQIMDVKKEELDLTKVAESLGGHIVEVRKITKTTDRPYFRKKNVTKFDTDEKVQKDTEERALEKFLKQQNISANKNNKKVEITYGKYDTRRDKVTGDAIPIYKTSTTPPQGPKRAIRDRNRVLQRVRIAARTAKRPVQRLVKPSPGLLAKAGKVAIKNPFTTLVGASMAKDTFFPMKLPRPPVVRGGKVGRRTAG